MYELREASGRMKAMSTALVYSTDLFFSPMQM